MDIKKTLQKLEKRGLIKREPSISTVFLLSVAYILIWILHARYYAHTFYFTVITLLTLGTLLFSIVHMYIVAMLKK